MGVSGGIDPPTWGWTAEASHPSVGARWFSSALSAEEEPSFRSSLALSGWNLAPQWEWPYSSWCHHHQLLLLQIIASDSSVSCFVCDQLGKWWSSPTTVGVDYLLLHVWSEKTICYSRNHQATRLWGAFQTVVSPYFKEGHFCPCLYFLFWFGCND